MRVARCGARTRKSRLKTVRAGESGARAQAQRRAQAGDARDREPGFRSLLHARHLFPAGVATELRLDSPTAPPGHDASAEDDLGLDDHINQGRIEVDIRMNKRHHLRVDYFKLSRFRQQPLPGTSTFGDFTFAEGTKFRT